ncbi:MAG: hypothetical protein ACFCU4_08195 [Puniceicoccaceae bacterium]
MLINVEGRHRRKQVQVILLQNRAKPHPHTPAQQQEIEKHLVEVRGQSCAHLRDKVRQHRPQMQGYVGKGAFLFRLLPSLTRQALHEISLLHQKGEEFIPEIKDLHLPTIIPSVVPFQKLQVARFRWLIPTEIEALLSLTVDFLPQTLERPVFILKTLWLDHRE